MLSNEALEKKIQKALPEGLFLDKLWNTRLQCVYYAVRHLIDGEPYTAVEWVYPDGTPKPLSEDIIAQVHSQEGSIKEAFVNAVVANEARKERIREERDKEVDEIAHEYTHEKRGKKSVWLPKMKVYSNLD